MARDLARGWLKHLLPSKKEEKLFGKKRIRESIFIQGGSVAGRRPTRKRQGEAAGEAFAPATPAPRESGSSRGSTVT
jgi:hypothetical protein